jgi:tetratricopeptide (TPR) repeat protein/DNA-binding MarR family transcriptional regulator
LNILKSTAFIPSDVARGYRRKRFYSTSARILTHLSSMVATAAHEPGTLGVLTQEGIAAATHSGRTTATKWLTRLEAAGLIAGDRAHVPGHRVRKTVYRLTHEGWVEARKLQERFRNDIVEVLAPNLDATQMRVAEIPEIFPAYVNLTATVSLIRRGRLDITKLHGIGSGAVAPVLWGDTVRRLGRVFGRSQEVRTLDAWCASSSPLLVVTGLAGIGKSSLVASWLVRQRPRAYIYWFEIHEGTTRAIFLRDLAAFLARLGRRSLKNLLAERRAEDPAVTVRVLAHDLRDVSILLVLDNFQAATSELTRFVAGPVLRLSREAAVKILLISRTVPSAVTRRRGPNGPHMEVLRLGGLDPGSSLALLRSKGFAGDDDALERAANSAKGHPILLSFAAQTGSAVSGAIARYLDEEIWRTLTRDERTILEAASLFRGLVPLDSLHCFSDAWQEANHGLQAKNLLAPTMSGGVVVHDSIREHISERLPEGRRRQFHSLAAEYFLDGTEMRDRLEGLYHLVEAGNPKAFGECLVSQAGDLLDSVPASELLRVLRTIERTALEALPACVLPELMGDGLRASGDLQPALLEYRHAVQRAEGNGHPERLPRLLRKIASIERCRDETAKALGHLIEAQGRVRSHPQIAEEGEILREQALVEMAQGELAQASAHLNEAVDRATEVSEPGALARSLTALGSIEARRGNGQRALEFKLEGLRVAERGGNLTETARACIGAGVSLHDLGRHEEALKYYDRALQIARVVGNIRLQGYALMDRAAAMVDLGLYQDAGPILEEAKRFIQMVEEPSSIALLLVGEGQIEMGLGRWNRAVRQWERGLEGLKKAGADADYVRSAIYVGRFYLEHGDLEQARTILLEADRLAQRLGGKALIDSIEALRQRVESIRVQATSARQET